MDLHMPHNEITIPLGLFKLLVTLCFIIYMLFSHGINGHSMCALSCRSLVSSVLAYYT